MILKMKKRRHAIRKLLKKYMLRRQYSVFIGELSQKHINEVKSEIKKLIDENEDSVLIIVILIIVILKSCLCRNEQIWSKRGI